jgi:outer membrane protein OmpA-like peptidoglycan-associated protein
MAPRRKHAFMKHPVLAALFVTVVGGLFFGARSTHAQAEEPADFSLERFSPAPSREDLLDASSGVVPEHLDHDVALWGTYSLNPLVLYREGEGGRLERAGVLVGHRVGAHLVGALALFEWVQIAAEMPLVLYQGRGAPPDPADAELGDLAALGLGDLKIRPRIRILRQAEQWVNLSVAPVFTLPTARPQGAYFGDSFLTFTPELAASRSWGSMRGALNLALRLRPESEWVNLTVGHEVLWRGAFGFRLHEVDGMEFPLELGATLHGATPLATPFIHQNQNPLEVLLGATWDFFGPWQAVGALGTGLSAGFGAPDLRVVAAIRYSPRFFDKDKDGIEDHKDQCPKRPEDKDGYRDGDGCPDPDNDKDGVLDKADRCPDVPGEPDYKGCPPGDRDGDGIKDDADECPDQMEDVDGFEDENGCPDPDNDDDGTLDTADKCPVEPGPKENNGCPKPDRDKDGVPDEEDECPDLPGSAELKGCLDQDSDGIPDPQDQCPTEPETINGVDDEDGCPDKGKIRVKVTKSKVEILEKVFFDTGKDVIKARSHKLLNQVALTLKANPAIELVRIEGHTDNQGGTEFNQDLSEKRAQAVRRYLLNRGVARERLDSKGFGESKPVASNASASGREKNRRVEFRILVFEGERLGD